MKNRELNFVPLRRGVLLPHGKYSYFIVLISIIYFPGLTELCHFPFKIQILSCTSPSCTDPVVTVAAIIKRHQTKHNYAFRDLWNR